MLKKTQGTADVDASRILVKGPEFLRRQMERESEANKGRVSAVERLAATKPQYVKSQQVVSIGSASVSSQGSSNGHGSPANVGVKDTPSPEEDNNVVRRSSSKKRPDSILLYRQKCELMRGFPGGRRFNKRSLFSLKDKTNAVSEARESDVEVTDRKESRLCATREDCVKESTRVTAPISNGQPGPPPHRRVTRTQEQEGKSRRGVARSSSDISSRYSKNFADFDVFFKFCGLEGDVIDSMGKENFSARSDDLSSRMRSISVSTSDDAFSRSSDGLHEEELQETVRQGVSVVERNARIIKWLYSCRNAAESGKVLRDLD